MGIILTFVINSGLNFVLGLVIAKFLGPDEFGRYAVASAVATVLNTLLLDWLRLSAVRFYSQRTRDEQPAVRATLDAAFAALACTLLTATVILVALGVDFRLPASLAAATALMAIGYGVFDYCGALVRARFLERTYATLILVKTVGGFALMAGGAFLFADATVVALGLALSALAALLVVGRVLRDPGASFGAAQAGLAVTFARYGLPLVIANALFQLIAFANRTALASAYGFAEAGHFSLASDLGIRLFATAGSMLDILLFQLAVRQDELHGRAAAERQVSRNMGLLLALLVPVAAGYWLVLPAFEAVLVPAPFRGSFAAYTTILIPALFAFGIIQFALNPVFQLARTTTPAVLAALIALAVDLVLIAVLPRHFGPMGFAIAQVAAMATALLATAVLALRIAVILPPVRDVAGTALGTVLMTAALWPFRGAEPHLAVLAGSIVVGGGLYAAAVLACDVGGLRMALRARLARRGTVSSGEAGG